MSNSYVSTATTSTVALLVFNFSLRSAKLLKTCDISHKYRPVISEHSQLLQTSKTSLPWIWTYKESCTCDKNTACILPECSNSFLGTSKRTTYFKIFKFLQTIEPTKGLYFIIAIFFAKKEAGLHSLQHLPVHCSQHTHPFHAFLQSFPDTKP